LELERQICADQVEYGAARAQIVIEDNPFFMTYEAYRAFYRPYLEHTRTQDPPAAPLSVRAVSAILTIEEPKSLAQLLESASLYVPADEEDLVAQALQIWKNQDKSEPEHSTPPTE